MKFWTFFMLPAFALTIHCYASFKSPPPIFNNELFNLTPINVINQHADIKLIGKGEKRGMFNSPKAKFEVTSSLNFEVINQGLPIVLHRNNCLSLSLQSLTNHFEVDCENLLPVNTTKMKNASELEDSPMMFLKLDAPLELNERYTLVIKYSFEHGEYNGKKMDVLFDMNDLEGKFLEQYLPSNFEFDSFRLSLSLEFNSSMESLKIFSNGKELRQGNRITLKFPDYFNTSSPYLHLIQGKKVYQTTMTYSGLTHEIPILIYSMNKKNIDRFDQSRIFKAFSFAETQFGPYYHERFLMLLTDEQSLGGMEYAGATASFPDYFEHELYHSWFARGAYPANGNAGWIDEAIVNWLDPTSKNHGQPRHRLPSVMPINFAARSPYLVKTEDLILQDPYVEGMNLIAFLHDRLIRSGNPNGIFTVLSEFYSAFKGRHYTTEDFIAHLEKHVDNNILFQFLIYGK